MSSLGFTRVSGERRPGLGFRVSGLGSTPFGPGRGKARV